MLCARKLTLKKNITLSTACLLLNMEVVALCGEEQNNRGMLEAATCEWLYILYIQPELQFNGLDQKHIHVLKRPSQSPVQMRIFVQSDLSRAILQTRMDKNVHLWLCNLINLKLNLQQKLLLILLLLLLLLYRIKNPTNHIYKWMSTFSRHCVSTEELK